MRCGLRESMCWTRSEDSTYGGHWSYHRYFACEADARELNPRRRRRIDLAPEAAPVVCAASHAVGAFAAWVAFSAVTSAWTITSSTAEPGHRRCWTTYLPASADYNGHLMPGSWSGCGSPPNWRPLSSHRWSSAGLILQMRSSISAMFLGPSASVRIALRRSWCRSRSSCSPRLPFPGLVWWAAALNQLPQQLFMLLAVLAHLRYVRTERRRDAMLAPSALLAGLAFSEKTLLAVPLLFIVTWLFFVGPVTLRGLVATISRYRVHAGSSRRASRMRSSSSIRPAGRQPRPRRTQRGATWSARGHRRCAGRYSRNRRRAMAVGTTRSTVDSLADASSDRAISSSWCWPRLSRLLAGLVEGRLARLALLAPPSAWRARPYSSMTRVQVVGVEAVAAEYRYFTDLGLVAALAIGFAFWPVVTATRHDVHRRRLDAPPLFPSAQPHIHAIHQPRWRSWVWERC